MINLCIEEKKMVFLNGESDKKVLREKLLDIIKKSDKDGSFFDYLERKSF